MTVRKEQTNIQDATDLEIAVGYTPAAGTVAAGDTTQEAIEKLDGNIGALSLAGPDAVVDAGGGGDYTSVATALTSQSAGDTIKITGGTYNETSTMTIKSDMVINGAGMDETIINLTGNEVLLSGSSIAGTGTISITNSTVTGVGANLTSFSVGDYIVYNKGIYTLATITDANNATIEEDVDTTSGALAFYGLTSSSPANVIVRDLTFDVTSTVFGWLLRNEGSIRCKFERVRFRGNENVTQGLIRQIGMFDAVYEDCLFETPGSRCIRHENRNLGCTFKRCNFVSATSFDHEVLRSQNYSFEECEFWGGDAEAIKTSVGPVDSMTIVGCKFRNKGTHPIHFDTTSGGTTLDAVISNNQFSDCGGSGIYINNGGGVNITGNIIQGQTADGVQIDNVVDNIDILISGNTIRDNGAWGVDNDSTSADTMVVTGNNLTGNTSGGVDDAGSGNIVANNLT